MTTLTRVAFHGWPNCYRLSNDIVELVVTTDVGPRVIHFGLTARENEFMAFPEQLGITGGDQWHSYGGHRFWHAPEALPRTYHADNHPVQLAPLDGGLRLVQPVEPDTRVQKEIDIHMSADAACVRLTHRLRNRGLWRIELACWALSVMAPGGTAIIPLPPQAPHGPEHVLPVSGLAFWSYSDPSDPRYVWGSRYILMRQDPALPAARKLGASVPDGWAAYARGGHLFVKRFHYDPVALYPDLGSCVELFTDAAILELETLGPLVRLEPGESLEHTEEWYLYDDVPRPLSEADVDRHVAPRIPR